jgi:hypothetical protein
MFSSLILSVALTVSPCEGGVCRAPVRTVVERSRTVRVEREVKAVKVVRRDREGWLRRRAAFWR